MYRDKSIGYLRLNPSLSLSLSLTHTHTEREREAPLFARRRAGFCFGRYDIPYHSLEHFARLCYVTLELHRQTMTTAMNRINTVGVK